MPLVTKKKGISRPNPTASSLGSNSSASRPCVSSRTIPPAANAPRITSRPRSAAITTSPNSSSTVRRTGTWPLVSMLRSMNSHPRPTARIERSAASTASTTKTASRSSCVDGSDCEPSSTVTISTGPNSPTAPTPSTNRPSRVSSLSASRRTGRIVPSAVVDIAEPTSSPERTTPSAISAPAIA